MSQQNIKSYKNRLLDFGIVEGTFKDNGEEIKYKSVVIEVEIDGEVERLNLSGASAQKPKFLELTLKSSKVFDKDSKLFDEDEA